MMSEDEEVKAHELKHTITEFIEYPTHAKRSDSVEYKRNHAKLIYRMKLPCYVCNYLDLPKHSEEHLETHHFVVEWAAWESADPQKVQRVFDSGLIDFYGYSAANKGKEVKSPDDIRNLIVLCPLHHKANGVGIHETTSPIWFSQMVAKNGVEFLKGALEK